MDKKVEVINKFGQTLAIFTSEDEETIDRMIDPVVTLTQNSDNVFSFSISEKSQKWEDIKSIENLYIVDGHVYSPLFEDSYTHIKTEDGENLIQVRAYERQKMLEKTFVTAWNSKTGFADIDAFMVVILSKGNLPLKNGNKATGVEVIVDPGEYSLGSAGYIMKGLLYGTGWDVGIADVEGYFDFETEQLSVYENLLKVQEMYGGILIFDSMNKLVHLRQESNYISYTGYEVRYKKNLKDMELAIDNKIVTRLYVFGEAGLNIASVNDDKIYLENYTYSNEIFEGIESNTDIYEPDQLKAWGERKLLDLCAPRKVLTTNIAYLTQKEGFEQEKLKLNDSVRVYYDEAEFVAPEAGVEIVATEIEAEGVKAKKESYITLKGNTSQETVESEDGEEVIDTDIAIINADIEKENYIELQGNTSQATSILPDEYQQVEYIESDGNQYIDTDYIPNYETKIYCKFAHNEHVLDTPVFGARTSNYGNQYVLWSHPEGYTATGNSQVHFNGKVQTLANYPEETMIEFEYSKTGGKYGLIEWTWSTTSGTPNVTLAMFTLKQGTNIDKRKFSGKMWAFKIWDNEILVRDFIPCYRKSDNVIGMYDIANGTFYTNLGTGNFTKGADLVIPNPDYPQDIHVVKGENVVSVQGKNLANFPKDVEVKGYPHTLLLDLGEDKTIDAITVSLIVDNLIFVNQSVNGAILDFKKADNTHIYVTPGQIRNSNNDGLKGQGIVNTGTYSVVKKNITFRYLWFMNFNGATQGTMSIQAEYGSTATPYVPYSKTDYPINLVSKNKLDLSKIVKGRLDNGIIGYESGTTSLETTNNELTFATNTNYRGVTTDYIEIKNSNFILFDWLSKNNDNLQVAIAYYDKDKNYISQTSGYSLTNAFRFSNNVENSKYIRVYMSLTVAGEITIQEPQIEFASNVNEFEEYFNIELCKINTYKDYFHKDSGKWFVHKEINKIVFDGSENFTIYSSNTSRVVFLINISGDIANYVDKTKVPNLICSHFVAVTQNKTWANGDISRHTANQKGLYFTTKADETIDTFKNWLSSNNVSVYYPLATPTEEEITDTTLIAQLEALYTAELAGSTTYISTVADDLEPFIDLKYNVVTQVPSPQKPSEVQVVTGENKFEIVGKQLYNYKDTSNVTTGFVTNDEGWISLTYDNSQGTTVKYFNYWTHNLDLKPSQKYALFVEVKSVSGNASFAFSSTQGTNGQVTGGGSRGFAEMTNNSIYRAEITARDSYTGNIGLRSFITYSAGRAGSITFRISVIEDLTISKEDFKYEPYQKTSYTVNFGDLELCNINNYQDYTFKNSIENPHYNPDLELNAWYKYKTVNKVVLDDSNINLVSNYGTEYNHPRILINKISLGWKIAFAVDVAILNRYAQIKRVDQVSNNKFATNFSAMYMTIWDDRFTSLEVAKELLKGTIIYIALATPTYEKITDLALATQLEALYKATLVSPYSHIYSDTEFPIIDLRYNVITPSLYIESSSDLLRVTGVDYPVFNPSSATLTLGDVTLNTNNIFKKISNTTNAYNAGLIPAGSVKITESDGTARPITQEFEVQHTQNATFSYDIRSVNGRVDDVYTLVDENGNEIKRIEEHSNEFEETAYGLINTLKNRSGNNLLRNSSACFGNEFWTGLVKKEATLDEVHKNFFAKSCFNLQNGTLGQQIAVPNGEYYIGFKYKKLIELANCSIDINGTIVELTSMDYETSDNFIQVNDYSITIKLISDTDDACFVGDIMIVAGNKEKWSPNPNEIYYDSVEIGKGIQVNSNTANTYTRIDADGNRIYNRNSDEIVTELTQYGLSTERVECKEIKGAGILIQEVRDKYGDNQTWITKI